LWVVKLKHEATTISDQFAVTHVLRISRRGILCLGECEMQTKVCEHKEQSSNDEIVVKMRGSLILNTGYVCSKCKQPVFVFEDLMWKN